MKKLATLLLAALLVFTTACAPANTASSSLPASQEVSSAPSGENAPGGALDIPDPEPLPQCVTPPERVTLRVAALKGPSAIGMLNLMERQALSQKDETAPTLANDYQFTLAGAPDQVAGGVIKGEYDIAVLPTNLAATVYNKTQGQISLATINTLGVLYLVENQAASAIKTPADLKGKTIYATGKGTTPEYVLNYVLEKNDLKVGQDVQVEYKTEHTELATLLAAGQADIALLPQPFVTTAMAQNDQLRVALDMTQEWEKVSPAGSTLAMSGIVVQKKLLEENPVAVASFMAEYRASTQFATDPATLDAVSQLAEQYEIIPKAAVAKKAIPQCSITYLDGQEMQAAAQGFLEVLFAANPQAVGGKLPDADFYYIPGN